MANATTTLELYTTKPLFAALQVEAMCSQWLRRVSELFSAHGPALLQACGDVSSLHAAEEAVCAAITAWRLGAPTTSGQADGTSTPALQAGSAAEQQAAASGGVSSPLARGGSLASSGHLQPVGSPVAAAGGHKGMHVRDPGGWDAVSEAVLGRPLSTWQVCYHAGAFI